MPLAGDVRLGPYEILGAVGSGGMGEVYRARDTRLSRTVAIKLLPSDGSQDREDQALLQREARVIAALNHPHICTLHDIGHESGLDFLVMEYVEGETVARRLERGALSITESLRYGIEILAGLEHAHGHGIVHCDLKPSNIQLTKTGAKLLDFGVATMTRRDLAQPSRDRASSDDTLSLSAEDAVYGTVQYMAPERFDGEAASPRTDLFAFGVVLFEMLTGRKAFEGRDRGEIIAAILSSEPIVPSQIEPRVPAALDHVIARCLARHPDDRWLAAHDVRLELQWILEKGAAIASSSGASDGRAAPRARWMIAGLALIAGMMVLGARVLRPEIAQPQTIRFTVEPPDGTRFSTDAGAKWMNVSPDGRWLEFSAIGPDHPSRIWLLPLDSTTARPLPGTEGAVNPFWSPDSRFLAFSVNGQLRKVSVFGGVPQTLCAIPAKNARGGTWNRDGTILFAPTTLASSVGPTDFRGGILRVSADGGPTTNVTSLDPTREEAVHAWPQFLPDGRHFLYRVWSPKAQYTGIYLASLDDPASVQLRNVDSNPMYALGHLLFARGGTLFAQPIDVRARLTGSPAPVAEDVVQNPNTAQMSAGVSETGILAYAEVKPQHLVSFDRSGQKLGAFGPDGIYRSFSISPTSDQVAVSLLDRRTGTESIWIIDERTNQPRRLTFGATKDNTPIFSPDGSQIMFTSHRNGRRTMYEVATDGSQQSPSLSMADPSNATATLTQWSRDGRFVVFNSSEPGTNFDISVLPLTGARRPFAFLQTAFNERDGHLSPDGRWMVYASDESGLTDEIYVRPFPQGNDRWQVSVKGGSAPKWRGDGREIFYMAPDGALMSAMVGAGPKFTVEPPEVLFKVPARGFLPFGLASQYDVTADGNQFVFLESAGSASPPITVVVNWQSLLHR